MPVRRGGLNDQLGQGLTGVLPRGRLMRPVDHLLESPDTLEQLTLELLDRPIETLAPLVHGLVIEPRDHLGDDPFDRAAPPDGLVEVSLQLGLLGLEGVDPLHPLFWSHMLSLWPHVAATIDFARQERAFVRHVDRDPPPGRHPQHVLNPRLLPGVL